MMFVIRTVIDIALQAGTLVACSANGQENCCSDYNFGHGKSGRLETLLMADRKALYLEASVVQTEGAMILAVLKAPRV